MIIRDRNNLSECIGRVTIAYIGDTHTVRVIASATGEVLREDPAEEEAFGLPEFRRVVRKYRKLCTV